MKTLQIIFFGMACFDRQPFGYRVLLPDGRDPETLNVPPHEAAVWIRPRSAVPTTNWPHAPEGNDFPLDEPAFLTITGFSDKDLYKRTFANRLSNLKRCDPKFTLREKPDAILTTEIRAGVLTAHRFPKGMIAVQWKVRTEDGAVVRLTFQTGTTERFIELQPATRQVILADVRASGDRMEDKQSHFVLYRKLGTPETGPLPVKNPRIEPQQGGLTIENPSVSYDRTPFRDCSGAFSR